MHQVANTPVTYCPGCHQIIALGHADWCPGKNRIPKPTQENLLQLPLGFSGPRVRALDPDTSREAAEKITPKRLTEIQQAILDFFRTVHKATDEEIEKHLQHKYSAPSTLRKRRTDLVSLGYLRDSGHRRRNSHDRLMIVWELIAK